MRALTRRGTERAAVADVPDPKVQEPTDAATEGRAEAVGLASLRAAP